MHAGENSGAEAVFEAITEMHAERIGHGYHVLDDPQVYAKAIKKHIHFEVR